MAILSKACKPDTFESHNSLNLSFTNIRGPPSIFVDCESFLKSNSPDILGLWETNLGDLIDSGNFSVRGHLPLIGKDSSSTHMLGLEVCVFFPIRVSSTDTDDSQGSRRRVETIFHSPLLLPPAYEQSDIYLHLCM